MAWEQGRLLPQPHSWALAQCSSTWSTTSGNSTTPSQGLTSHLSWRAPHLLRPRRDSLWGAGGDVQHPLHFITLNRTDSTALAMRLHRYLQPWLLPGATMLPPLLACPFRWALLPATHPHKAGESGKESLPVWHCSSTSPRCGCDSRAETLHNSP